MVRRAENHPCIENIVLFIYQVTHPLPWEIIFVENYRCIEKHYIKNLLYYIA